MNQNPLSFALLYKTFHSLADRKEIFERYARQFHTSLYCLRKGFAFPELLPKNEYSDQDYLAADGIAIGERKY